MNMPLIRVSEQVKEKLEEIKKGDGHTSVDSVLRYLLERAGESDFIACIGNYPILKEGDYFKIGDEYYKVVKVEKR